MDRSEYISLMEYWYNKGKEKERAKIVAWLRRQDRLATLDLEQILADEIEAWEHLK